MKHHNFILVGGALISSLFLAAQDAVTTTEKVPAQAVEQKVETQKQADSVPFRKKRSLRGKKIDFDFTNKPLVDIINEIASALQLNIIFPQGALAIQTKITYHPLEKKVTPKDAWQQVLSFLDLAGYTARPEGNALVIVRSDNKNVAREPLNLYIDEPLANLPNTEEVIRAIFYLANLSIKVSGPDIQTILSDMLSPNADIKLEAKTNALILTDKAANIKGVMKIIKELDKGGTRDAIEVLPIYYMPAQIIDDLFNKQLLTQPATNGQPGAGIQSAYFPKNTKIMALGRGNSLIIMGTPHAIDLVKDFIIKYIDRPLESGESILHVYELKYLNAKDFAPVLQQIVNPAQTAQTTGQTAVTGPRQYFKDVIVQAELIRKTEEVTPSAPGGTTTGSTAAQTQGTQIGGNRLVIAARKQDWVRIEKLIQDLDKPQPQVALEVLVVDLTLNTNKILGNQMRNKSGLQDSLSNRVNFQSAQLDIPVLIPPDGSINEFDVPTGDGTLSPNALMANLLQVTNNANLASNSLPGTTVISLRDGASGVWSVWRILDQFGTTSILAQPFVVTTNHKQATVTIVQDRLLVGSANTQNTAVSQQYEHTQAGINIDILPHISLTNNINLQITVQVNAFEGTGSNNINTRVVQTSANVGNGQILALGGLIRNRDNIDVTQIPILGDIPILGWFFKRETKVIERNNLLIFICPTIIEPRLQGGIDTFTQRKLGVAECNLDEHLNFETLRDPITRWFFKPNPNYAQNVIDDYTEHVLKQHYENGALQQSGIIEMVQQDAVKPVTKNTPANVVAQNNTNADALKTLVKNEENPLEKKIT